MLTHPSLKNRLLAFAVAGGLCLIPASLSLGADCGCSACCDECATIEPACSCDCESMCGDCSPCLATDCDCFLCRHSRKNKPNCIYKALDALAGGVEKVLGLDRCGCNESVCDDGCDAGMMGDLSSPMPPHFPHSPQHIHSHAAPHGTVIHPSVPAQPYSGPTREVQITPTGPSQWQQAPQAQPRMTHPRTVQPRTVQPRTVQPRTVPQTPRPAPGQHLGGERLIEPEAGSVPPPVRLQTEPRTAPRNVPKADPKPDGGSIFDSLSDPFGDDEVRVRPYRSVRPSSYDRDGYAPAPVQKRPLSRSYSTSKRRVRSIR